MPKALALTPDALSAPQVVPQAATPPRAQRASVPEEPAATTRRPSPQAKPDQVPLQLRIPKAEAKRIKLAALEAEQNVSDFMLACFHASIKNSRA